MYSPRKTKGFTFVELLVVIGIGSIVLGALGFLYTFTARQTSGALAEMLSTDQATTAANEIDDVIRNSFVCVERTKNGLSGLRCTLPSLSVDRDSDGTADSYRPAALDKFGREDFAPGTRVWFYFSDATGAFGTAGPILWRATRNDDSDPIAAGGDADWTYQYGVAGKPRFPLVSAFSVEVDANSKLVTFTLTAESADYADHKPAASDRAAQRRGLSIVRAVYWENSRT